MAKADSKKATKSTKAVSSWDNRTPDGREKIDKAVAAKLGKAPKQVRELAEALGMEKSVVSRALVRLVSAKLAVRTGERGQAAYAKSA